MKETVPTISTSIYIYIYIYILKLQDATETHNKAYRKYDSLILNDKGQWVLGAEAPISYRFL